MTLNDKIIRFYDDTSPPCNATALRKATRRVTQIYDEALQACGLKSTQRTILRHVDQLCNPTMMLLADVLVLDKSALSHNLKPLIRDGYLVLKVVEQDRRLKRVELTESGRAKLEESHLIWVKLQEIFESALTKDQHQTLLSLLELVASEDFGSKVVPN